MELAVLLGLREPLALDVAGVTYVVTPPDVRGWLLAMEEPFPLLPLLDYSDALEVYARMTDPDDVLDTEDLGAGWRVILQSQAGEPWWVAEALLGSLIGAWRRLSGMLALKGMDLLHTPLDLALSALLALLQEGMDEKDWTKFDREIRRPPPTEQLLPGQTPRPGFGADEQAAAWKAAAGEGRGSRLSG